MIEDQLKTLGTRIAHLRFVKQMKQSELAYEAGVSLRTLQRQEAGEIVRSDVLLKVIGRLGKLDSLLATLETSEFSPYEMLASAGIRPSQLEDRPTVPLHSESDREGFGTSKEAGKGQRKRRVRRALETKSRPGKSAGKSSQSVAVLWPEDK